MINANRLVYNNFLTACKLKYDSSGILPSVFDLNRIGTRMRHNSPYVASSHSTTINELSKRAIMACEKTLGKSKWSTLYVESLRYDIHSNHFPRYRNIHQFSSIRFPSVKYCSVKTIKKGKKERRVLKIGKVPGLIRCYNQSTKIDGAPVHCIITRKDLGSYFRYYASLSYEPTPRTIAEPLKGPVGIDLGISNIATLSDGTVFHNDRIFTKFRKTLDRYERQASRFTPGSHQYAKIRTKISHVYDRITNYRKNNIETISSYIVKNYGPIAMENLPVQKLRLKSNDRFMSNDYNDASLGKLKKRIFDKAASAGREIILVDPKDTSQVCSNCHRKVEKDLNTRIHECPYCGFVTDRDLNASINILERAGLLQTLWVDQPPMSLG